MLLLPYQQKWFQNDSKYAIWEKGRRCGASWTEALWSVARRLTLKEDHFFCSTNERTAQEFIRYCLKWAEVMNLILGHDYIDLYGATSECLTFPNGSRIIAMSSNPDALRGMGGSVTLDEFAFSQWSDELYTASQPVIAWGGALHIISTHNGYGTTFYNLLQAAKEGKNDFSCFRTTLDDALNDGLALKIPGKHQTDADPAKTLRTEFERNCVSKEAFQQEYLCEISESQTVISPEEYKSCVLPGSILTEDLPTTCNTLYMGCDVGRHHNLTILWAVEHGQDAKATPDRRDCYRFVAIKALNGASFAAQQQIIEQWVGHPKMRRAAIDATGIGMSIAETLNSKFPHKVEQVYITHVLKPELVERVKKYVAQNRISLPDNQEIQEDICAMKRIATRTGRLSYDGSSGKASHCDYYIALAMALHAAENYVPMNFASTRQ